MYTSAQIWALRASPALPDSSFQDEILPGALRPDLFLLHCVKSLTWASRDQDPLSIHCYYFFLFVNRDPCCLQAKPQQHGEEIQNLVPGQEDVRKSTKTIRKEILRQKLKLMEKISPSPEMI